MVQKPDQVRVEFIERVIRVGNASPRNAQT
jgi:hypothetical protein